MPDTMIAGLELGGTKCVALLGTGPDHIVDRVGVPTDDPATTLGALEAVLDRWTFGSLGIAAFGPLDLARDSAAYGSVAATTKPGWSGTALRSLRSTWRSRRRHSGGHARRTRHPRSAASAPC